MASKFSENMAKVNEKVLAEFKEEEQITFTPKSGEPFQTDVILGPVDGEIRSDETGEVLIKTRRMTIPVPELLVEFADGIITIEGEDWVVTEPGNINSGLVDMQIRWNKTTSKHGEMHKKRAG